MSVQLEDELINNLNIDESKLRKSLAVVPADNRSHLNNLLQLISKKKKKEALPNKNDVKEALHLTLGKSEAALSSFITARIIVERKVGRVYQYDVHKDVLRS